MKVCRRESRSCAENWCSASVERIEFLRGVKPLDQQEVIDRVRLSLFFVQWSVGGTRECVSLAVR